MKKIFVLTVLSTITFCGFSQKDGWLSFSTKRSDTLVSKQDSAAHIAQLNYEVEDGTLNIHKDERLDELAKFVRSGEESIDGVLIDGYRVMIYFDQDRNKSEQQKAQFLSIYNDEYKAYVDYVAPNYRVRVGNFRTRLEAEKLKQELLAIFPTAIVVEDRIQLPELGTTSSEASENQ
ncbi:MAG: SPOR domain-containing protein [Crocinitomicaceae bacterium]|nr:SPOR domain-containing protein [Crocinitomicaceae bacterium]